MIFNLHTSLASLNDLSKNTLVEHLDIEFIEIGEDFIIAKMPVDHRHVQPYGILHGGASVVLAETLGSVAAHCVVSKQNKIAVGLDINANHIKAVKNGYVYGKAKPIHIGRTTHVWQIEITNENQELVCVSRITMAIMDKQA